LRRTTVDFNSQLRSILKRLTDKAVLEAVGQFVVDLIRERVRGEGRGVKTPDGNKTKLKPLSKAYIKQRQKDRNLHPETTPATSNLTRTGQMLDSLRYRIRQGRLEIYVDGGTKVLNKVTYTHADRPWVNLGRAEKTEILKFIEKMQKEQL
jgi:hypothetical protein